MSSLVRNCASRVLQIVLVFFLLDGVIAGVAGLRSEGEQRVTSAGPTLLELVPFGYVFNADRPEHRNAPETQWLTDGTDGTLAGVMWEEHRPVRRVEVLFAGPAPEPESLSVEVTTNTPDAKQRNRPTWWTRRWEPFPGGGARSGDGRTISYETVPSVIAERLKGYPKHFQFEPDPDGLILIDKIRIRYSGKGVRPIVAGLKVYGNTMLKPMEVDIEFDYRADQARRASRGTVRAYNGEVGRVMSQRGSGATVTAPGNWKFTPSSKGRRILRMELNYVADDEQTVRFKPDSDLPTGSTGTIVYHPNRTVISIATDVGSISFAPLDLDTDGPILVPSAGVFVSKAKTGTTASVFESQLRGKGLKTVPERVRNLPEQSLARVLDDHYTAERPAYPEPEDRAPMRIDVSDPLVMKAWDLAFWHVKRRCSMQGDTPLLYIWPYKSLLGQESWRIAHSLDLLGEHAVPGAGFKPWFEAQGKWVAAGMFFDKAGALNVPGWDLNHGQGHGSMLYVIALHYLLTRDTAWLREHENNLEAACEWIVRQRKQWTVLVGQDSWAAGLMPPTEFGDYAEWRSLYQTNVIFYRGLKTAAEALNDIAPERAARYKSEAEAFRQAIVKSMRRSAELAPVIKVADGTYRQFVPSQPYLRGLASEISNPFGAGHAGTLVLDTEVGAVALALGVVSPMDPIVGDLLDVLEDRLYLDNWVVKMHQRQRGDKRNDAWFSIGAYYYQCGYSQSALVHLLRDDVPNYLRSTFNQYAADVDPAKKYQFREHPNRTGEGNGGDKTFEVGAFLERMRSMFVLEDEGQLWLARATPRDWLQQGRHIAVTNAPSVFGTVAYEITSDVDHGRLNAIVDIPSRLASSELVLRLRHPDRAAIKSVTVNGRAWSLFDKGRELVRLKGLQGRVRIAARY
ncbi:MAG: hypothetical protein ABFD89_23410 [Bryobacteraceae bacterium]